MTPELWTVKTKNLGKFGKALWHEKPAEIEMRGKKIYYHAGLDEVYDCEFWELVQLEVKK